MANDAPPTYTEATKDGPPTYESLFSVKEMKEAKENSSNKGTFAAKVCEICCGSVACLCCLLLMAALPVAMVIIGSIYLYDCPGQRNIPIWLIVFGVVSLFHTLISIFKRCAKAIAKKTSDEEDESNRNQSYANRGGSTCESILSIFLFIWVVVGSVWVFGFYYSMWAQNDCTNNFVQETCQCNSVVFLFSYITLIVMYAVSLLICVCGCCCIVGVAFCIGGSANSDSLE